MSIIYYTRYKLIFGFQNPISLELYIFLNHKILDLVDRRVWKRALHDTNILCRSGFYTRRNPEIPKDHFVMGITLLDG